MLLTLFKGGLAFPLSLAWTGYWRASWSLPWPGEDTTGPSLGRDLYEAVDFPGSGTAQNGYTPPAFDGTNDLLTADGVAEDYLGATGWTIHAVVRCNSLAAPGGFTADNEALISVGPGSAAVNLAFDSTGVTALQYDGFGGTAETTRIAVGTTDYRVIQARWNGALLECRVDGGSWQSVACTSQVAYSGVGEVLRVGVNYDGTKFLDCDVLEIGTFDQSLLDADLDALYSYADTRYALTAPSTATVVVGTLAVTPAWPLPTLGSRIAVSIDTLAPTPSWPSPTVLGRVVIAPSPLAVAPSWPSPTLTARSAVALSALAVTPSWPSPTLVSRAAVALGTLTPTPSWPAPTLAARNAVALAALLVVPAWPLPTLDVPAVPVLGPRLRGRVSTGAALAGASTTPRRLRGRSPSPATLTGHAA
jgi:hypothetical protein